MTTPFTDRWELVSRIRRGGFGEVWNARDLANGGARVAVKLLGSMHTTNPEAVERFGREGRILARIASPFVCRVLDSGVKDTTPFLVLEHIDGEPLDRTVKGGKQLPLRRVATILADILAGLAAVHAAGVVHRDLKPSNVLVGEKDRAKLIDFGISKLLAPDEMPLTSTSSVLGSPAFMAPEQVTGTARVDARCDLYAAGLVGYRMLAGVLPFATTNPTELSALKCNYPSPSLAERTGYFWPPLLEAFFARMLATRPEDRPADASTASHAWTEACAAGGSVDAASTGHAEDVDENAETPVLSRRK